MSAAWQAAPVVGVVRNEDVARSHTVAMYGQGGPNGMITNTEVVGHRTAAHQ